MNYNPNDVYNVDETKLFYRMLPDQTLLIGYDHGQKQLKDLVIILFGRNMTRTDKLKHIVIGSLKFVHIPILKKLNEWRYLV